MAVSALEPTSGTPAKQTWLPRRKVLASAVSGLVTFLIVAFIENQLHIDVSTELSSFITAVVMALVGYLIPPGEDETVNG